MENVFLTHAGGLGIGHVTECRAVAFAPSAVTDLTTQPPQDFRQLRNFVSVPPFQGYVMCTFL